MRSRYSGCMENLAGRRYGRWMVLGCDLTVSVKHPQWHCRCDCGQEASVRADHLRNGRSRSCGCLQVEAVRRPKLSTEQRIAAAERHAAQGIWHKMIDRCHLPDHRYYRNYGGRGITVCARWLDFENYFADMWPRPAGGLMMDRIDNDGNYEPRNVRWASRKTQNSNQRRNRRITFKGETLLLTEWAERFGIKTKTLWMRLHRGWSLEKALRP